MYGSTQPDERNEKKVNLRQESTNSVPCGQESVVEELMIPGFKARSGIISKFRADARGENTCLNR